MDKMLKRINAQSAYVLAPIAALALLGPGWIFSLSIILGGLIGVVNLKGIVWSVTALLGTEKAQTRMIFLSLLRLLIILSVLVVLAVFKLINAYGILAGFTIVFIIIVKEGLLSARREAQVP
jgi:hypothetical protein